MKNNKEDKLGYILRQTSRTKPKEGFEQKLMRQIYQYEKKRKRRSDILNIVAISGGIILILLIPIVVSYSLGHPLSDIVNFEVIKSMKEFSLPDISLFSNPFAFLPISILLLLVADILIRKKLAEKDNTTQSKSNF